MKIKHVLLAAVLMGSLSATAKDYHYTTIPGDAMKTRIYTLDNGLTVYMSVNKEKPRLQANIAVKTGSRNDPAETTGLAHYLEHLMFKGTQKFGKTGCLGRVVSGTWLDGGIILQTRLFLVD